LLFSGHEQIEPPIQIVARKPDIVRKRINPVHVDDFVVVEHS